MVNSFVYVLMCVAYVLVGTVHVAVDADSADVSFAAAPLIRSMCAVFHPNRNVSQRHNQGHPHRSRQYILGQLVHSLQRRMLEKSPWRTSSAHPGTNCCIAVGI